MFRTRMKNRPDPKIPIDPTELGLDSWDDLDFEPDTDTPMTFVELAREMDRLGTPCGEDEELSVDVDDFPLF